MAGENTDKNTDPESNESEPNGAEEFARNMVRLLEESGKAASAYLAPREGENSPPPQEGGYEQMAKSIGAVAERWFSDPEKALEAQTRLWAGYANLWSGAMRRAAGEETAPAASPAPGDKRFNDEDWSKNQYFDFVKQAYLLTAAMG